MFSCFPYMLVGLGLSLSLYTANATPIKLDYPLDLTPSVSSTFGTYRISHHHAGIDLYATEGTPVLAAADGRVSLIKRGNGGYGRVVYLRHADHYQTVYAHLSAFAPDIEREVKREELRRKRFDLKFRPRSTVEVKRGQVIGWVGSSGTDLMHLHFELRKKNTPINPLTNGLNLPDTQAPIQRTLFIDPMNHKARINGGAKSLTIPLIDQLEPIHVSVWGDIGFSLEVNDRIDGSVRDLTPAEIIFEVNEKVVHHLKYERTSYRDHRQVELDFDLPRRGLKKRLVHRLYQIGPKHRGLVKSKKKAIKRLKEGKYPARIIAKDAKGNQSVTSLILHVERPPKQLSCMMKRKRLKRKKVKPQSLQGEWGISSVFTSTGIPCQDDHTMQYDIWANRVRLSHRVISWSEVDGELVAAIDLKKVAQEVAKRRKNKNTKENNIAEGNQLNKGQKKGGQSIKKSKIKQDVKKTNNGEKLNSKEFVINAKPIKLFLGIRNLDPTPSNNDTDPPRREYHTQWWSMPIIEVKSGAKYDLDGFLIKVSEKGPVVPYFATFQAIRNEKQPPNLKAQSKTYQFTNAWLPMSGASELLIPVKNGLNQRYGAFLRDGPSSWWVTYGRERTGIVASSTHLATFTVFGDETEPTIGEPTWDLKKPLGPRLIIPISDHESGLGKVELKVNGKKLPYEVQRAWSRIIYRPLTGFNPSTLNVDVLVKDRAKNHIQRTFSITYPPKGEDGLLSDLQRTRLEPHSTLTFESASGTEKKNQSKVASSTDSQGQNVNRQSDEAKQRGEGNQRIEGASIAKALKTISQASSTSIFKSAKITKTAEVIGGAEPPDPSQ